nr:MAG TPA: hypothetical protein [Caudoviricetes sp.]
MLYQHQNIIPGTQKLGVILLIGAFSSWIEIEDKSCHQRQRAKEEKVL